MLRAVFFTIFFPVFSFIVIRSSLIIYHMRKIRICLGSSCYSRGNNVHLEVIRKYIAENHLEAQISFSGHLCEELCSSGPILRIDDKIYKEVNLSGLYRILQEEFPPPLTPNP